jgi:hypothetical protein
MRFKGKGIVWDPERNCALCQFQNGELHTTDKRTIQFLQKHGFEHEFEEGDIEEEEEPDDENDGTDQEDKSDGADNQEDGTDEGKEKPDEKTEVPSNDQLKALLDQKGIKYDKRANKETLTKLLQGAE